MITLKHLAQRYNLDPYLLRQSFREQLEHEPNQRWKWKENDQQLTEAEAIAKSLTKQPG